MNTQHKVCKYQVVDIVALFVDIEVRVHYTLVPVGTEVLVDDNEVEIEIETAAEVEVEAALVYNEFVDVVCKSAMVAVRIDTHGLRVVESLASTLVDIGVDKLYADELDVDVGLDVNVDEGAAEEVMVKVSRKLIVWHLGPFEIYMNVVAVVDNQEDYILVEARIQVLAVLFPEYRHHLPKFFFYVFI